MLIVFFIVTDAAFLMVALALIWMIRGFWIDEIYKGLEFYFGLIYLILMLAMVIITVYLMSAEIIHALT